MSHSGKITLYRVPLRYLVAFLAALLLLILSILGHTDLLGPGDQMAAATALVQEALTAVAFVSTFAGWKGLAGWLKDPKRSTVD